MSYPGLLNPKSAFVPVKHELNNSHKTWIEQLSWHSGTLTVNKEIKWYIKQCGYFLCVAFLWGFRNMKVPLNYLERLGKVLQSWCWSWVLNVNATTLNCLQLDIFSNDEISMWVLLWKQKQYEKYYLIYMWKGVLNIMYYVIVFLMLYWWPLDVKNLIILTVIWFLSLQMSSSHFLTSPLQNFSWWKCSRQCVRGNSPCHNILPGRICRMHPKDCWGRWSYKSTLQSFGCSWT